MTIIRWPGHRLHHRWECKSDNWGRQCMVCEGNLTLCLTCGGAESSLPTDCPGRMMTDEEADLVADGVHDYDRVRGWVPRDAQARAKR